MNRLCIVLSLMALPILALAAEPADVPAPRILWRAEVPPSGSNSAEWDHEMLYLDTKLGRLFVPVFSEEPEGGLWEIDAVTGKIRDKHRFDSGSGIEIDGSLWGRRGNQVYEYIEGKFIQQSAPAWVQEGYFDELRGNRWLGLYPNVEVRDAAGAQLWKRPPPRPNSMGPAEQWNTYEDRGADVLYILYDDDHLVALDSATGEVRWHDHTSINKQRLLPRGGVLLLRGNVLTARAADGAVMWTFECDGQLEAAKIWPGGIYALDTERLYSLDFDGKLRWRHEISGWPWCCGPDGACYFITPSIWFNEDSPDTKVVALDGDGNIRWSFPHKFGTWDTQFVAGEGVLYLHSGETLYALTDP